MPIGHHEIILHHYDASPFSQKVRAFLGLKRAAWRSVLTPNMLPKPDLVPLTGGYRRAPVLQVGADVYIDSQLALAELERRLPSPRANVGPAFAVNLWSDRLLFQATVAIIFGRLGGRVDPAFITDREALSGRPFDPAVMAAASGPMRGQWRGHAAFLDQALASTGAPFLAGHDPTLIDIAAHMNFWWLGGAFPDLFDELTAGLDHVRAWHARVGPLGQGTRVEMTGQEALEVAKAADPAPALPHDPHDVSGVSPGEPVIVSADDYGRDPIAGALVSADANRLTIARETADLRRLHLHFPRVGYVVTGG